MRDSDCAFNVELTLSTVVKQLKRCVASLLDLCNDEVRADRVDCTGGYEYNVFSRYSLPCDEICNRAVANSFAQLQ